MATKLIKQAKKSFIKQDLPKREWKPYKRMAKFINRLNKQYNKDIKHLKKAKNKCTVSKWFSRAYNLTQYLGINCRYFKVLQKYHINEGQNLINTYKYDLHALEFLNVFSGKPTKKQAKEAGNIGTASVEDRENKLAFIESSYPFNLHWYVLHNGRLDTLDKQTAIEAVNDFKEKSLIIPN